MPNLIGRALFLLLSVLALVSSARGSALQPASQVTVTAAPSVREVAPGDRFAVAVVLDHQFGWHSHTNAPVVPASWKREGFVPFPTTIHAVDGTHARVGPVQWPKAHGVSVDLVGAGKPQQYEVFEGRAIAFVPVRVPTDASGEVTITFEVGFQACDDKICNFAETASVSIAVPVGTSTLPGEDIADFADFDATVFDGAAAFASPSPAPAQVLPSATANFFGIALPRNGGVLSLLILFALAAVGGLILNLTPCVLPVIPLKIMAISQHAGTPGRTLYLGLWMAAGVMFFWVAIGVPAMLVSAWGDASQVFAIWWVTFGMGALIAAMAVGMLGVFQFSLPQGVYMLNPKADNAWGSFLFGVMTAVLGLPCFGFVVGGLSAATATLPKVATLLIYAGLGVGMALPYLVLAVKPGWLKSIPRTGPASDLVKQVLGLLLLGAGVYFIGSGLIGLVANAPWTGRMLHWWGVALCGVIAAVWLVARTFRITQSPARRAVFGFIAAVVGGLGVWFVTDLSIQAKNNPWVQYTPAAFASAQGAGKVVVVDFTAEWCINCKVLKAQVLSKQPAKQRLLGDDVVLMKVDYTGDNPEGKALQDSLNRVGIPLLAVFPKGGGDPWLANQYTGSQVVEALDQAGARVVADSSP